MMNPGRAMASPPGDLYPLGNAGIHPEWGIALMRHPTVPVIHLDGSNSAVPAQIHLRLVRQSLGM